MTITTRDSLLTIRGLSASVDETPILHDIDLAVGPGETHVIMGPNGAGKSTLGHVVMGDAAYRVDGGSVEFDGRDITDLSPDKRSRAGLFLSFQAPVEIPGVPLSSFLRATVAGRDGKELKGKQFKKHVRTLADELDMDPSYLDRELGVGFSGGEKKKLEMLQLLLLEPKLAILDETDSGLDVDALGVVSRGIDAYRRATGGALVVITHNTRILEHVDVDRVQSVMVKQSFIRRLLGYCELSLGKIDAAAENSDDQQKGLSQQGLVIHPFVKMSRVPEILAGIVPEFADVPTENIPVAPVGLRRALIRRCIIQGTGFWLAVLVAAGQIAVNLLADPAVPDGAMTLFFVNNGALFGYALAVVLLVLDAVGAVLWFRGSGFAYNERFMQVSNGGFARETISFPRKKIQFGYTKTNPFQRNAGTATVNARTAAGVGGTTIRLIDAREDDARAWLAWLKPHGNVIQ